jgi:hypothetical protein
MSHSDKGFIQGTLSSQIVRNSCGGTVGHSERSLVQIWEIPFDPLQERLGMDNNLHPFLDYFYLCYVSFILVVKDYCFNFHQIILECGLISNHFLFFLQIYDSFFFLIFLIYQFSPIL